MHDAAPDGSSPSPRWRAVQRRHGPLTYDPAGPLHRQESAPHVLRHSSARVLALSEDAVSKRGDQIVAGVTHRRGHPHAAEEKRPRPAAVAEDAERGGRAHVRALLVDEDDRAEVTLDLSARGGTLRRRHTRHTAGFGWRCARPSLAAARAPRRSAIYTRAGPRLVSRGEARIWRRGVGIGGSAAHEQKMNRSAASWSRTNWMKLEQRRQTPSKQRIACPAAGAGGFPGVLTMRVDDPSSPLVAMDSRDTCARRRAGAADARFPRKRADAEPRNLEQSCCRRLAPPSWRCCSRRCR